MNLLDGFGEFIFEYRFFYFFKDLLKWVRLEEEVNNVFGERFGMCLVILVLLVIICFIRLDF